MSKHYYSQGEVKASWRQMTDEIKNMHVILRRKRLAKKNQSNALQQGKGFVVDFGGCGMEVYVPSALSMCHIFTYSKTKWEVLDSNEEWDT